MRLLSYNIRFGGVGREALLARTVRQVEPDLVVLQEATRPPVIERLARETGMCAWGSRPRHSVGFMSRLPVKRFAWHLPRGSRRAFLEIALDGTPTRIFGIHLSAINSNWTEGRRTRELRATLEAIQQHATSVHVLAGDFNTLAPGETLPMGRLPWRLQLLAWFGGRSIRWRTVQVMLDAGYRDAYRDLHAETAGHTFPAHDPHVRLDYVFVPQFARERLRACEVIDGADARVASDHLPVLAEVEL